MGRQKQFKEKKKLKTKDSIEINLKVEQSFLKIKTKTPVVNQFSFQIYFV